MRRHGYTDFVEACYLPATGGDAWVRELAVAARSAFGVGWGEAFTFRVDRASVEIGDVSDPRFETAWLGQHGERRLPPAVLPAYKDFDVARLTALMRPGAVRAVLDERPLLRGLVSRLDSMVALQGRVSPTSGVMVVWDAGHPLVPAATVRLRKLAAHLRAGARVRAHRPLIHAVLDHDGRVHHAEAGAKDRRALQVLSRGARAIERARVKRTIETLETWHALWDGRWTLVDSFDKDGKRWLVAKENHTSSSSDDSLQPRERDVALGAAAGRSLKLMAYELGLPLGTVAATLSRAMRKLRVRSRAELSALLAPLLRGD
ncbi:MAG: LuxR C-terminal-related transcriptional regulator [Polyangiaceae bacterium]